VTSSGEHPHATGVSTEQDVVGDSLRGEQQHENLRAKKEIINTQVGIDHSRLSDDHILLRFSWSSCGVVNYAMDNLRCRSGSNANYQLGRAG